MVVDPVDHFGPVQHSISAIEGTEAVSSTLHTPKDFNEQTSSISENFNISGISANLDAPQRPKRYGKLW